MKTPCAKCNANPCACSYMARLESGALGASLLRVAREMDKEAKSHDLGCPCPHPRCWSGRASTWGELWIQKEGRGLYAPVPSVPSVPTEKENGTHGTHGTPVLKVVSNDD